MSLLFISQHCHFWPLQNYMHVRVPARTLQVTCPYKRTDTAISTINKIDPFRRSAYYEKNIWSSDFIESIQSDYKEENNTERINKLKEEVISMITDNTVKASAKLELIDKLERLGIAYHFENEIKTTLNELYINKDACIGNDLHSVALYFRVLRKHGYTVSEDIFNCFLNKETSGSRLDLSKDVKGMLSLYEASHLRIKGEDNLRDATDFSIKHLKHLNETTNPDLAKQVAHALELPLHHRMQRLEARYYIEAYEREEHMNPTLLEFAKIDFNMLQAAYQQELITLSRWWENLGLSDSLRFTRDRCIESFIFSIGMAYKPQYRCCREWITKAVYLILTIDDIYDINGTFDELHLFTAAVKRWDLKAMESLPEYMKICFLALFNTMNKMVYMKQKNHNLDILLHVKKVWADFCKAMLVEANWSRMGYTPSLEEYLDNIWTTSSLSVVLVLAIFGTEQTMTNEVFEILNSKSDLLYYSSMILRLCNDLATSSAEQERGDVASAIQCYIHETNSSELVAREKIRNLISEMWMNLNDSIYHSALKDSFLDIVVNSARAAHSSYQHGDEMSVQDIDAKKRVVELLLLPIGIRNGGFMNEDS